MHKTVKIVIGIVSAVAVIGFGYWGFHAYSVKKPAKVAPKPTGHPNIDQP
jgi:hypothetical protein